MTVRELIEKSDKRTIRVIIVTPSTTKRFEVDEAIPEYLQNMRAADYSYYILKAEPYQLILWIHAEIEHVRGYRFITLAGRHDKERIVEVLEWEADHLNRDALRNCMLSLYSHASIGDWTVHGYLERIENGWYHSTVCSMSAVTLMSIWPDKVASTEIRVNDKFVRRMGGSYAGQRTN